VREVTVYKTASEVPAPDWDALAGADDLYLSRRWLEVAQAGGGAPFRYFLAMQAGRPAAAVPAVLADAGVPWITGRADVLLPRCAAEGLPGAAALMERLGGKPASTLLPTLQVGGRHVGRSRVLGGGPDLVRELIAGCEDEARSAGAATVTLPYVDERDVCLREVLSARGYACYVSGSYSWLEVPPGGFPQYAEGLPARRRRRVLAERRQIAAAGVSAGPEPLDSGIIPRLADLEVALLARYGTPWPAARSAAALRETMAAFGTDAFVVAARDAADIRGFALILRHRDRWYARQAGFDYEFQGNLPLYFEVAFYRLIELAADAGVPVIHYGLGSRDAKRSRGCRGCAQYGFVLPLRDGLLRP